MSAQRLALAGLRNIKHGGIMDASLQKDSEIGVSNGAVKSCLAHNVVCSFFASSAPFLAARTKGDLPHRRCSIGTPTSFPGCPLIGVREGSNKTVTGALQMSPSLDAPVRQSPGTSADSLESHIKHLGAQMMAAHAAYEISGCFADIGKAHGLRIQMQRAIALRSPAQVRALEAQRGLS